jgi:hypothetical protein
VKLTTQFYLAKRLRIRIFIPSIFHTASLLGTSLIKQRDWDSSVDIETAYGLGDRAVGVRVSMSFRPALGSTQTPIQWAPGGFFPGVKLPGRKADHSPPASAEVKKMWIYTSTPLYAFIAYCLISLAQRQLYLVPLLSKYLSPRAWTLNLRISV